jgi:phosphoribosylformylglycinamidine synthase
LKKVGVIRFPGTNCDRDVFDWVSNHNQKAEFLWHLDQFSVADYTMLVLPGGFSYGDYLRSGALAARSPVMKSVREFALQGRPVLGICNGFQILCEAEVLPGALVKNEQQKFIDEWAALQVENPHSHFGRSFEKQKKIKLPIAHGDGRFYAPEATLKKIEDQGLVWLRYLQNPNGSLNDIAGIMNEQKNVVGLMPHPERASLAWMGGIDGKDFL